MAKLKDSLQNMMRRREADAESGREPASDYDTLLSDYQELQRMFEDQAQLINALQRDSGADPLTSLANHRTLGAELERSLATARRYGRRHGLILLSIVDFTNLSNQLGEAATDAILRHMASLIRQNIRPTDVAAHPRFGEFAIILNELRAIENATQRAEELCTIAANTPCVVGGRSLHCMVVHGLTVFGQDDDAPDVLARTRKSLADAAPAGTVLSS